MQTLTPLKKGTRGIRVVSNRHAVICESFEPRTYFSVAWGAPIINATAGASLPLFAAPLHTGSSTVDLAVGNGSAFATFTGNNDGTFTVTNSPAATNGTLADQTPFVIGNFAGTTVDAVPLSSEVLNLDGIINELLLTYYHNDGSAIFTSGSETGTGFSPGGAIPISAVSADFTGDGKDDIAILCKPDSGRLGLEIQSETTFVPTSFVFILTKEYTISNAGSSGFSDEPLLTADFGNHHNDIAVYDGSSGNLDIFMNDGVGDFTALSSLHVAGTLIASGKFTSSGNTDLVLANGNQINLLKGNGDGTFTAQPPVILPGTVTALATADINLDGKLDVITDQGILLGNGDGTFQSTIAPMPIPISGHGNFTNANLIATDLNGDGKPDLVGLDSGGNIESVVNDSLADVAVSLRSSSASAGPGTDLTFTTTLSSPFTASFQGHVNFFDGSTLLGSAPVTSSTATFDAETSFSTGVHSITAHYSGNTSFAATVSSALTQSVFAPATTVLSSTAATANAGDLTTFNAIVSGSDIFGDHPSGTVEFLDNNQPLGSEPINAAGIAVFTTGSLGIGVHAITAQYSGDSNFLFASSAVAETINQPPLSPRIVSSTLPAEVVAGIPFNAKTFLSITNTTSATIVGFLSGTLLASSTGSVQNATAVAEIPRRHVSIRAGGVLTLPATMRSLPASLLPGAYTLLAQINSPSGTLINTVSGPAFRIDAALVVLTVSASSPVQPVIIKPGHSGSFTVTITNTGNIATSGPAVINVGLSVDGVTLGVLLGTQHKAFKLKPGHPLLQHLHFTIPRSQPTGRFQAFVSIVQNGISASVVGATAFSIG